MKKEKEPNFFKEMDCFIKPYKKRYILSVILSMISVLCELLSYAFIGLLAGNVFNDLASTLESRIIHRKRHSYHWKNTEIVDLVGGGNDHESNPVVYLASLQDGGGKLHVAEPTQIGRASCRERV